MNKHARMGRPRGNGPRIKAVSEALARYDGPDLGLAIGALVAHVYPVPIPYGRIARELDLITGVKIDPRVVHQWMKEAYARLVQVERNRKEHEQ